MSNMLVTSLHDIYSLDIDCQFWQLSDKDSFFYWGRWRWLKTVRDHKVHGKVTLAVRTGAMFYFCQYRRGHWNF